MIMLPALGFIGFLVFLAQPRGRGRKLFLKLQGSWAPWIVQVDHHGQAEEVAHIRAYRMTTRIAVSSRETWLLMPPEGQKGQLVAVFMANDLDSAHQIAACICEVATVGRCSSHDLSSLVVEETTESAWPAFHPTVWEHVRARFPGANYHLSATGKIVGLKDI